MTTFGFRRMAPDEFEAELQKAFSDYIFLSLSELGGEAEDNRRLYIEAQFHLHK